ncbi:MAG: O-antigen ligase family protein [Candidatus Caenarcaniphilales bacterium]|nr:O-antigen ligase family protein [Candidatus Caenarcaniphilales bacterium]
MSFIYLLRDFLIHHKSRLKTGSFLVLLTASGAVFFSPTLSSIALLIGVVLNLLYMVAEYFGLKRLPAEISEHAGLNLALLALIFSQLILIIVHRQASDWLNQSFKAIIFFLPCFWIMVAAGSYGRPGKRLIRVSFISFSAISSLVVLGQGLKILPLTGSVPSGLMSQPFTTGGLILIGFYLALDWLFSSWKICKWKNKPFLYVITIGTLISSMTALVMLSQRSLWLALGLSMIVWLSLNAGRLKRRILFMMGLVLLLSGALAFIFMRKFRVRLMSLTKISSDLSGYGCRVALWKENTVAFLQNPIAGIGEVIELNCRGDLLTHAHNIYLQQLVTGGLVAFVPWVIFLGLIIWLLWTAQGSRAGFCACIALMIEGFFENWWGDFEIRFAFWLMLGLLLV